MDSHATADYSYYRRRAAEGRLILAGDAAGFLDPIFSSGVYLALRSAKHAAALVVRAARMLKQFNMTVPETILLWNLHVEMLDGVKMVVGEIWAPLASEIEA